MLAWPEAQLQYLSFIYRPQQSKEVMRRGVTHQDEIIGGVLVVAGCIQGHHPLQECLRRLCSCKPISMTITNISSNAHTTAVWLVIVVVKTEGLGLALRGCGIFWVLW